MNLVSAAIGSLIEKYFPRRIQSSGYLPDNVYSRVVRDSYSSGASKPFNYNALYHAYKTNSWVFASVNAIVSSCVAVPFRLRYRQGKKLISPIELSPIGAVLKYPNPFMTMMQLMEKLFLHLEITGNAFWEIVTDPTNSRLVAVYPLNPQNMQIIPHPTQFIERYDYDVGLGDPIKFSPNEIVHFKYEDPSNDYWGLSSVYVMLRQARLETSLKTFTEKFFENDATPGLALKTSRSLTDATYNRLRKRWAERHAGMQNKFSVAILEDGMDAVKIGTTLEEINFTTVRDALRDEMMVSSGVPPTLLGVPGISQYASARVAQSMFFDSHIAPRLRKVALQIDKDLIQRFDPVVESVFDTSIAPVNVVKLSANSRVVARLYGLDLMTKNEGRALLGLPPVEGGDQFKIKPEKSVDDDVTAEGAAEESGDSGS